MLSRLVPGSAGRVEVDEHMNERKGSEGVCTRRQVVAGGAVAATGLLGGCLDPIQQFVGLSSANQVSLRVIAPPRDWDERANDIAGRLVNRLETVGVDVRFPLLSPNQFSERILYERDFDVYVGTMPLGRDPDFLRPLLSSTYADTIGWQNPFGFADMSLDDRLDAQRRQSGEERTETVGVALETIAGEQPFVPIATRRAIAAVTTDRFEGWGRAPSGEPTWLFELEPAEGATRDQRLRMATKNRYITDRLNPLMPWISGFDVTTWLLYDPLARYYGGKIRPWLAEEWWDDDEGAITVKLRPDLHWHDDEPLTADDVRFTYRFLSDTTLGSADTMYPAPRFQQQTSLVEEAEVLDDRRIRIHADASQTVAPTALTAPLLPKHIWESRTGVEDVDTRLTRAITADNVEPVGCGPMKLEEQTPRESMRLGRFEDHPLNRDDKTIAQRFGPLAFSELLFLYRPPSNTVVALEGDEADAAAPILDNDLLSEIDRSDSLSAVTSPSRTLYHVGFNTRRKPLRNPAFRRAVAHMVDKRQIIESVFDGYADPRTTPVLDESWIPEEIQWNSGDPEVPFSGVAGELDAAVARDHFRKAGYNYDDDGRLVY